MLRLITQILALTSAVSGAVVATGATTNGRQARLEIRDIAKNADQWALYIQALVAFQADGQKNIQSYYGIATIHGFPGGSYDGSRGVTGNPSNCPHGSPHFPMWHRAYLMLYEQRLVAHAIAIAEKYPSNVRSKYVGIAKSMRLAYWDWAIKEDGTAFPHIFTDDTVTYTTPTGRHTVSNPLKRYKFNPNANGIGFAPYSTAKYTNRWPQDQNNMNSPSNQNAARSAVDQSSADWSARIYKLLTKYTDFNQISNEAWIPSGSQVGVNNQDSFESVHDAVHGATGGNGGFMQEIPVSTYDPLFWMHHANIDRLLAMWQIIHPNSFFQSQQEKGSTFWYSQGSTSTPTQGNVPFKKNSKGDYWNANDLRDWTKHGYNYKDTPAGGSATTVRNIAKQKYGSSSSRSVSKRAAEEPFVKKLRTRFFGVSRSTPEFSDDGVDTEYMVNIRAPKNALQKPYTIFLFLGDAGDCDHYSSSPNFAGSQTIIARRDNATTGWFFISAQLLLNRAINDKIAAGEIKDSCDETVQTYLQQKLNWKVVDGDGQELDPSDVPELAISVAVTKYGIQNGDDNKGDGYIASNSEPTAGSASNGTVFKSDLLSNVYAGKPAALQDASSLYTWGTGSISGLLSL